MSREDQSDVPPRLLRWPLFLMLQVLREAGRLREATWPDERLRFAHHGVLACLADAEGLSQRAVSDQLRIDPSDLVKVVDLLEREGWLVRERDPTDRRRHRLRLTDAGRERLAAREALLAEANEFLMAPLSDAERRQFEDMLRRMRESLVAQLEAQGR
ncbi:MAG: MarR family transcriptional regulator [Myxococcota bacterium]